MQYFRDGKELLELFGVDPEKPGAEDFYVLADLYALMARFPQYHVTVADLARLRMSERGLSPMVFWSRMKRAIRPLVEAESETLRALGVPCGWNSMEHRQTCPELIGCIGAYSSTTIDERSGDNAAAAAEIARRCGRSK